MPATDTDFEREFAELVAQLREVPTAAPDSLRARVRALGEPEAPPTLRDRLAGMRWRRSFLLAAPACLAVLLSVAAVRGVLSSGGDHTAAPAELTGTSTVGGVQVAPPWKARTPKEPTFGPSTDTLKPTVVHGAAVGALGTGGRPADVDASLRVRVPNQDALGDRTAEAMRIARSLGGYVASVDQSTTTGRPGEADLVLRVPVGKVDTALAQLAGLGTVLDQHLSIVDLKQTLEQQQRRIRSLRYQIARLQQALRNTSLPADVRLRLQFELENARSSLSSVLGTNRATRREAALSALSLTLTTRGAAAGTTKHHEGRFERALRDAGSFLLAAAAVALFVLIAVSPLVLLVGLWIYGSRAYRRREEQRLLAATPAE